jgi:hypothetical protein
VAFDVQKRSKWPPRANLGVLGALHGEGMVAKQEPLGLIRGHGLGLDSRGFNLSLPNEGNMLKPRHHSGRFFLRFGAVFHSKG